MIPHFSKPNLTGAEVWAVAHAVKDGHLSDGVLVSQFEAKFRQHYPEHHVVAMNSGTSALHLALLAKGIGPGDEVIVTPYTFVASVNVVLAVGATPVFADINPDSYCLDPEAVAAKVTRRTKAIIPVDVFGVPADIKALRKVLPVHVFILEDAIEALGSIYDGEPVGLHADAFAFGFFPNKQITTCEGGVLLTRDEDLARACRRLSAHGAAPADPVFQGWGLNQRLSDLHAALGLVQLERFEEIQAELWRGAGLLDDYFLQYQQQRVAAESDATLFVYVIELPAGMDKVSTCNQLQLQGVPVKPYFNNLLDLPHLRQYDDGSCPVARRVASKTIALPLFPGMTEEHVEHTYHAFHRVAQ